VCQLLTWRKKKKLVDLLAKCRVAAAGVSTSTPTNLPPPATFAPNTSEPASDGNRLKGVVVAMSSEGKGWATSQRQHTLLPMAMRHPSATTLQVLIPLATLLCMKAGGEHS